MIPLEKLKLIVSTYKNLEKDLASSNIDKNDFVKKSKEYSSISEVIDTVKNYINYEKDKIDLEKIIEDKSNDNEMIQMAESELNELLKKKEKYEKQLKI